jgi:Protein of unknown function (DUF4035)
MTRTEMMEVMPADEFFEWMILEQIEPFGDKRGDIQAGLIQQILANIFRDRTQHPEPYELSIFLPKFCEQQEASTDKKPQTPEQQLAIFLAIQAKQNAMVKSSA